MKFILISLNEAREINFVGGGLRAAPFPSDFHYAGRDRARPLQNMIGGMKSYTDRQYRLLGMPFEVKLWQTSYYDHIIRNDEDLENTRQYIQNNPLKWISDKE